MLSIIYPFLMALTACPTAEAPQVEAAAEAAAAAPLEAPAAVEAELEAEVAPAVDATVEVDPAVEVDPSAVVDPEAVVDATVPVAPAAAVEPTAPTTATGTATLGAAATGATVNLSGTYKVSGTTTGKLRIDVVSITADGKAVKLEHALTLDAPGPWGVDVKRELGRVRINGFVDTGKPPPANAPTMTIEGLVVGGNSISDLKLDLIAGGKVLRVGE